MNLRQIIAGILSSISDKLTATKAEKVPDSIAVDVNGVVTDLNKLLKSLRDAGILKEN